MKKYYEDIDDLSYDINFGWFDNLIKNGAIPTKNEVLETVSYKAQMTNTSIRENIKRCMCRDCYVHRYSFPLMTKEVVEDMANYLHNHKVLEVCCGSGYISKCIKDADPTIDIICTDNLKWESMNDFTYWQNHFMEIENIDALDAIDKYGDQVDYVLLSWPEFNKPIGTKILQRCLEKNISMIYIGEDWGGCTANNEFFELIDINCNTYRISINYVPFCGIHDDIYVITKK